MSAENPVTASDQRLHRWLTSPSTSAPLVDDGQCTAPATKTYSVEFARSGRTFTCTDDENVLNATSEAGLTPPAACGQGMCGTCKTTIVSGTVDTQHNGGIRPREIANAKVLICCSNAERPHDRRLSRRRHRPFLPATARSSFASG